MTTSALLVTLLYGGVAGLVAGLVGIGGGALLVPYLYVLLSLPEWSGVELTVAQQVVIAPATSLAVVVPTALRGAVTYTRMKRVEWGVSAPLGMGALVGGFLGTRIAPYAPPELLRFLFSGLIAYVAYGLLRGERSAPIQQTEPRRASVPLLVAVGVGIGSFAVLLGVGGGTIVIPLLIYYIRLPLNRIAATSLGVVVFTALSGTAGYLLGAGAAGDGQSIPGLYGFVYVPAALALIPGAVLMVAVGAKLNQRLNPTLLRRVIGTIFVLLSARLAWSAFELAANGAG